MMMNNDAKPDRMNRKDYTVIRKILVSCRNFINGNGYFMYYGVILTITPSRIASFLSNII